MYISIHRSWWRLHRKLKIQSCVELGIVDEKAVQISLLQMSPFEESYCLDKQISAVELRLSNFMIHNNVLNNIINAFNPPTVVLYVLVSVMLFG